MPSQQSPNSRYRNTRIRQVVDSSGKTVDVLERRAIPEPVNSDAPEAQWIQVAREESLDSVADRLWQDPTLYWRLVDATTALSADELEHPPESPYESVSQAVILLPEEN